MSNRWTLASPGEDIGSIIISQGTPDAKRTGGTGAFSFSKSFSVSTAVHTIEGANVVSVVATGEIANIIEVRDELYGVHADKTKRDSTAQLVIDLYMKGFSDQYGDLSDQPATALACLQGAFTFVLLDAEAGYCLAARSANDAPLLFWLAAAANRHACPPGITGATETGNMLFSGDEQAIAPQVAPNSAPALFPAGCFFECSRADEKGRVLEFTRRIRHRAVQPVSRINSSGQLCGLGFYTESGTDLAAMANRVGGAW